VSLRARLTVFIALVVALALIAQGALGYVRYERLAFAETDRDLAVFLHGVTEGLLRGPETGDHASASVAEPRENPNLRARLIRGDVVVASFGPAFPVDLKPGQTGTRNVGEWRVMCIELESGVRLEGAISTRERQQGAQRYLSSLALTVPLFAALGALVAWFLAGRALAPLEGMIRTASRVADSGDLTQRVPDGSPRSELGRLSGAFNRMLERLQGFRAREASFVRYASHELRTPLTAMHAQLDAERQGWVTPNEALETARDQVERMTRLSGALLVLAREGRTETVPLDLARLAQEVAARRGATYAGPDALGYRGNPDLLERALENLLDNAAKYAPGAGVRVRLETQEQAVHLSVEDDGPGLPAEALERVREAFYRAPGTRASGSGLGLAVVEHVAEAHGGALEIENIAPHGLRAALHLNLEPSQARD
jgi:signal transduction histidine kinase